jgi:hypothetical protein
MMGASTKVHESQAMMIGAATIPTSGGMPQRSQGRAMSM